MTYENDDSYSDFRTKLYSINGMYGVACSGIDPNISFFLGHLKNHFNKKRELFTRTGMHEELLDAVGSFRKKIREKANAESMRSRTVSFNFTMLFAAPLKPESEDATEVEYGLYSIFIDNIRLYPDGNNLDRNGPDIINTVAQYDLFHCEGTGAKIADGVSNTASRFIERRGASLSSLSFKPCTLLCYMATGIAFGGIISAGGSIQVKLVQGLECRDVRDDEFRKSGRNNAVQLIMHAIEENEQLKKGTLKLMRDMIKTNPLLILSILDAMEGDEDLKNIIQTYGDRIKQKIDKICMKSDNKDVKTSIEN